MPFQHGNVPYRLTASTDNSLLKDADPALFHTLEFIEAMICAHVGPRLLAQAALEGLNLPRAVQQKLHVEPSPQLFADQFVLPALAIYRKTETYSDKAIGIGQDVAEWEFAYLLPPLTPRQVKELYPILRTVGQTIRQAMRMGHDPAYLDDAYVWEDAGISKARVTTAKYGGYEPIDNLDRFYRAIVGVIEVTEVDVPHPDAFEDSDGEDVHFDIADASGTYVDLARFATGPRFFEVSPSSGTSAGGTSITITGANLDGVASVTVSSVATTSLVLVNDITLTCVTPPGASGSAAITLTDSAGRSDTLTNGFTYT